MYIDGRRRSLVWPLVLIGLGAILLLNNLGIVDWSIWNVLWRMWPVLVIAIGLDMILGRRSGFWSAITVVIVLAMFTGAFWMVSTLGDVWQLEPVTAAISQELSDAETASVSIQMGVGRLEIGAQPESGDILIEGQIDLVDEGDYREKVDIDEDQITYTLSTTDPQYHPGWLVSQIDGEIYSWDLLLSPEVGMWLNVDTGVGKTTLDLTELQLEGLDVDSGVGEVIVYLPDVVDITVNVNAGIGETVIYLPAGTAVRLRTDTGIGNLSVDGAFGFENGYYYSESYVDGEPFMDLYVDNGIGNMHVVQPLQ